MGVRDELAGRTYHALKDLCREHRDGGVREDTIARAEAVLAAVDTHDLSLLNHPSGPASTLRRCPSEPLQQTNDTRGGVEENDQDINVLEDEEKKIETTYELFLSLLPPNSRVAKTPGKGATRALKRALKERTSDVVADAITGAFVHWPPPEHKSIEAIFGTFRNTSSLAERIDWLATFAPYRTGPYGQIHKAILDRVGVRERLQDVQREIRAALDDPENLAKARLAAGSELWLHGLGLGIVIAGVNEQGRTRFTIAEGNLPTRFALRPEHWTTQMARAIDD